MTQRAVHGALNSALAATIRAERAAQVPALSLRSLAKRSGVPYRSLVRYVNDERSINVAIVELVARGLDMDPAELMRLASVRMRGHLPEPPLEGENHGPPGEVGRRAV